jgi:hypothetical protein
MALREREHGRRPAASGDGSASRLGACDGAGIVREAALETDVTGPAVVVDGDPHRHPAGGTDRRAVVFRVGVQLKGLRSRQPSSRRIGATCGTAPTSSNVDWSPVPQPECSRTCRIVSS